ncbi:putative C2H2 finger domain protein [Aspergillus candidus]|uniref:C2H2 finger domain protein n=1 Tax=Aspergillus candidus TaxID=41067 RepID=A0A2I2FMI4_ASPCN|nr:C2H2 finger domain protein [Aspergillus candidus]PLB41848.1 C2H2 finger domain protein [Aspergillus candidus]
MPQLNALEGPRRIPEMDPTENDGSGRKRRRTRKVQTDRKFDCTFENCGKRYSRAEHLYRHQLNHTPKQIYRCDFPGCYRSFVRQDLCIRHRERHTTHGSQLQKRDHFAHAATGNYVVDSQGQPTAMSPPAHFPPVSTAGRIDATTAPITGLHHRMSVSSSPDSVGLNQAFSYPPALATQHGLASETSIPRSASAGNPAISPPTGPSAATFCPPGLNRVSFVPFDGPQSANPPIGPNDLGQGVRSRHSLSAVSHALVRSQDAGVPYALSTDIGHAPSLVSSTPYGPQAALQIPVSGYEASPLAASSAPAPLERTSDMGPLDSMAEMMGPGATVDEAGFKPFGSCAYPIFGGDPSNRSPFAMADDFAAWLFNEPSPGTTSSVSDPARTGTFPSVFDATGLQNPFRTSDAAYGDFLNGAMPQRPMSVTSVLDPGSPRAIMSEEKRQELLDLMSTRFNEAAYSVVSKRKDALMDGDLDDDSHVLSLHMMQTYVGSYWFHFQGQLPILHRPTFVADRAPNLLLLAVIAIGAATLDPIHGPEVTGAASELANFIAWHLRWELFMDADFRPPAKLWVFQALLLMEVYEKLFSTRALHERAHIHHDTTLTLMRRGSSLIDRSAFDSPGSLRDDRPTRSASGLELVTPGSADESWTHWIKTESMRRVAFAAFVLDSTHATMFGHSAKMVAHELRLPLPCDEALWSATSAAEVARVQSSLHANGVQPVTFLDGLKQTLNGQRVQTNAFGRTILMAGLLSVSWHMNQRDLQVSSLGVPQTLGGRDKWRSALLRAFDHWRRDFDAALGPAGSPPFPAGLQWARRPLGEDHLFESRNVLYGLAHMASHVDIVDCQIFAGAGRLMGRSITGRDYSAAREKMTERWATKASARDATFHALKVLSECMLGDDGDDDSESYRGRDDSLLNRPWVVYVAALVVWCYGYALEGPIRSVVVLRTAADQRRDMRAYLRRMGGAASPNDLETMTGRNQCMGLLMVLRDGFLHARWELLTEAANLLGSCITKLGS